MNIFFFCVGAETQPILDQTENNNNNNDNSQVTRKA